MSARSLSSWTTFTSTEPKICSPGLAATPEHPQDKARPSADRSIASLPHLVDPRHALLVASLSPWTTCRPRDQAPTSLGAHQPRRRPHHVASAVRSRSSRGRGGGWLRAPILSPTGAAAHLWGRLARPTHAKHATLAAAVPRSTPAQGESAPRQGPALSPSRPTC